MDEPREVQDEAPPSPSAAPERPYGRPALITALAAVAVLFFVTLAPIAAPVLLGAILAAFTLPLRDRLDGREGRRTLVAWGITLATVFVVLVPLGLLITRITQRLNALVSGDALRELFGPGGPWQRLLASYPWLARVMPAGVESHVADAARLVAGALPNLLSGIATSALGFFIAVLTMFYLLRDGRGVFLRVEQALPLEPRHTRAIFREFGRVGRAFIIGTVGTAVAQGVVAGVAYLLLGLGQPLLLGALTAMTALVPPVGSAVVWGPVALYLFASGATARGLVMLALGVFVVGTVDNVLRPLLSRGGLEVHPLLVFLGIFGGVAAFGISGLYLGPLFVALFMAVAHIYEREIAPATTVQPSNEDIEAAARAARK